MPLLPTGDVRQRLPSGPASRVPGRETHFLDEYTECFVRDAEEVYMAYGDSVILLPKVKAPYTQVDKTGSVGPRGKFGGQRVVQPQYHNQPPASPPDAPARPDPSSGIKVPAIVNLNPTDMERTQYGLHDADSAIVHISKKFLEDRRIVIDRNEYMLVYKGDQYTILDMTPEGNFLDVHSGFVLSIKQM